MTLELTFCSELWNLEKPLTPKHSRLFHLEPIGVGTFYVESLTSYIARLAEAHSVLPGALLALEVKPLIKNAVYLLTQNLCPLL